MTASKFDINSGGDVSTAGTSIPSSTSGGTISSAAGTSQYSTSAEADIISQPMMIQPNSPSSSSSTSKNNGDSTFEPTVDMMVNDFDDEQTLEEEEALAAQEAEDPSLELSNLQKESDMPIEELLALYNCSGPPNLVASAFTPTVSASYRKTGSSGSGNQRSLHVKTMPNLPVEETKMKKIIEPKKEETKENGLNDELDADDLDEEDVDDIKETSQLPISRQQSDEEEDGEYSPDEDEFKKTIMVGSEFQAVIPEGFFKYDDVLPYENEDKLLWDPSRISQRDTEEYLLNVLQAKQQQNGSSSAIDSIPVGSHLRDDEQALYLLLQCGHNTEEALRRKRINAIPSSEQMSSWSEDECRNFESGIRIYGKDFHTIQHTKVRTRSVGELVQFYYLWKKTERHDVFANKARLEKKKYNLHPGLTDYMDRFLEEQDSGGGGNNGGPIPGSTAPGISMYLRDRSLSPGLLATHPNATFSGSASVNYLLQADNKRNASQGKHYSTASSGASGPVTCTTASISETMHSALKDPLAIDDDEATDDSRNPLSQEATSSSTTSLTISTKSNATKLTSSIGSDVMQQRTMNQ